MLFRELAGAFVSWRGLPAVCFQGKAGYFHADAELARNLRVLAFCFQGKAGCFHGEAGDGVSFLGEFSCLSIKKMRRCPPCASNNFLTS